MTADKLTICERLAKIADYFRIAWVGKSESAETIDEAAAIIRQCETALHAARQFIVNGVALGYIRMPDPETPDTAHKTLPAIEDALAKVRTPHHPDEGARL